MSNMRKSFEAKAKLRRMADGGIFKDTINGVQTFTDAKHAAPGAEAYTPRAMRELPNAGITPGALPPMPAPVKLSVKPAEASPLPTTAPAAPQQFQPQDPYAKMTGQPPVAIMPRAMSPAPNIGMGYMAQTGGFGPTTTPERRPRAIGSMRQDIGANRQDIGGGYLAATGGFMASGGPVKGPGGPTDDEVGPVMLSDGEYVLPADTVEKVGKENLDALKDATHTPIDVKQRRGLRKLVNGGLPTEEEKKRGGHAGMMEAMQPPVAVAAPQVPRAARGGHAGMMEAMQTPKVEPAPSPRTLMGPGEALIRGLTGDKVLGPVAPVAPAATAQPVTEKLAPPVVRSPDGNFPGFATAGGFDGKAADTVTPPMSTTPRGLTSAQSLELENQGVGLGAQMDPVIKQQYTALPDAPQVGAAVTPSAFASPGAKQLNSKYYQDVNGAVREGTAPVGAPASVAAGLKTLGDPNGAPMAWSDVPRTYRSDTIREGVTPGEQVSLGNGIFATTDPTNGDNRLNSFTGVGAKFSADSAQYGPDPGGVDRARQDAIVEQNLQAKPREMRGFTMPEFRSNERDINARFDKLSKDAASRFSNPRAAGNLAKAQQQIEEARMAALNQDADNITRQQQSAMQFQSDQSRNALTERDLTQRAAQAARADETDRLGIDAQNQRAGSAAAQAAQFKGTELKFKEWETRVKNKQEYRDFAEFLAEDGLKSGGFGGAYVNEKKAKETAKVLYTQVDKLFGSGAGENADPQAMTAILKNPKLLYGPPELAPATQGAAVAAVAYELDRMDLGEFVGFGPSSGGERAKSAEGNLGVDALVERGKGDEEALHFRSDGGEDLYVAVDSIAPKHVNHFRALLKMQEEAAKAKKERN